MIGFTSGVKRYIVLVLIGFTSGDTVSGDSVADSGAEDHSQGSDFGKVTGLDDFDEDLGDGSAVLPL
nr:hypothetical protein Iba_chr13aCG11770 [Ipomoea batatas]